MIATPLVCVWLLAVGCELSANHGEPEVQRG